MSRKKIYKSLLRVDEAVASRSRRPDVDQNSAASSRPLAWNHPWTTSLFFMNSSCVSAAATSTMARYTGKNHGSAVNTLPHSFCATTRL